jgi:regulator of sigma E protease
MTIIYAILLFCLLIFVHEFGHLIAAKSVGIRVNQFALGMGPRLFGFQKGETAYTLRLFPIGGFCAMEGEDGESDDPRAFGRKSLPAKALVIVAGPFMNLLLAVLLLSAVIFSFGTPSTTVAEVGADSPAAEAGLQPGDTVLSIDGRTIKDWEDLQTAVQTTEDETTAIVVKRDGYEVTLESAFYEDQDGVQKIGVTPGLRRSVGNIFPSIATGAQATGSMAVQMVQVIGQLFTGKVSVKELTGPVGIVHFVGDSARSGWLTLIQFTALISLNLAVVNMLPIPGLDGSRLLFLLIRRVTGEAVSDELEGKIHFVGIVLLLGLMVFVTFQDITRFIL